MTTVTHEPLFYKNTRPGELMIPMLKRAGDERHPLSFGPGEVHDLALHGYTADSLKLVPQFEYAVEQKWLIPVAPEDMLKKELVPAKDPVPTKQPDKVDKPITKKLETILKEATPVPPEGSVPSVPAENTPAEVSVQDVAPATTEVDPTQETAPAEPVAPADASITEESVDEPLPEGTSPDASRSRRRGRPPAQE